MSGCSVGFRPSPGFPPKSNEFGGFDFTKAKLLEWSLVPVPANSATLRRAAKSAGGIKGDLSDQQVAALVVRLVDEAGVSKRAAASSPTQKRPRSWFEWYLI